MIIRQIEPRDYDKLRALHAKSPAKYEMPDFEGKNFITGYVVVDDNDEPHMLLCTRRTAEAYVVIDHAWDTPAYRLCALGELIEQMRRIMINLGYDDAMGTIGPDVPKSYVRRLVRFGCEVIDWTLVRMWRR